jgi:hypothetical protein
MHLRNEIERVFEGNAFKMPLFYSYPGGLRFELSEGGAAIDQFLLAMRKAREICADIFDEGQPLITCLRTRAESSAFAHRKTLRELQAAEIRIPRDKCVWLEAVPPDDWFEENTQEWWVNVAFETPADSLQRLLWCALAVDFGSIRPRPGCDVYLFELGKGIAVLPYDDRGMDVVGPNHALLAKLYRRHHGYLLEYDRAAMEETFGALQSSEAGNDEPDDAAAALGIYGEDLDPAEVTALLGVQPTRAHKKGERKSPRAPDWDQGAWILEFRQFDPVDPDAMFDQLLADLPRDPKIWQDLSARFQLRIDFGVHTDDGCAFVLAPGTVGRIAALGAEFQIHVHAYGDNET